MQHFKVRSACLLAAAVAMASAAPVAARQTGYRPNPGSAREHATSKAAAACVPACAEDLSPCDPFYFKRADGRCSGWYRGHR